MLADGAREPADHHDVVETLREQAGPRSARACRSEGGDATLQRSAGCALKAGALEDPGAASEALPTSPATPPTSPPPSYLVHVAQQPRPPGLIPQPMTKSPATAVKARPKERPSPKTPMKKPRGTP